MIRQLIPCGVPLSVAILAGCGTSTTLTPPGDGGANNASSNSSSQGNGTTGGGGSSSTSSGGSGNSTSTSGTASTSTSSTTTPSGDGGASAGSVLTYHNHINRDGFFVDAAFTKAALTSGTIHLDSTFDGTGIASGAQVRASPLYLEQGYGGNPTFYVADELDNVYAFNATGKLQKTVSLGTSGNAEPCSGLNHIGIRGTPAIDPSTGIMVLDAATGGASITKHTIYGIKVADLSTAWSLDVSTLSDPVAGTFSPSHENQRSAVLIVDGVAYVTYGGFIGDCGNYHGWVVGVPVATGTGAKAWATPATESGIWAPGGASSDGTMIYVATGNPGAFTGGWSGGFSLVRFTKGPVFSGSTNDYWVAANDTGDEDLGGSGPLMINPQGATPYVVQLGKDGTEYLLDPTRALGGSVSPSLGMAHVMNDEITNGPSWASISGTTYVVMLGNFVGSVNGASCPTGMSGNLVVTKTNPANTANPITTAWCATAPGGGSPIVTTSNGTSDALVWIAGATERNDQGGNDNQLHAFDLATGASVVSTSDKFVNVRHFTAPIVVHGRIFLVGDTKLYAYKP